MRAARRFVSELTAATQLDSTVRIRVSLFGSLGATGVGHGTTNAIVAGLEGAAPETCDPESVITAMERATLTGVVTVGGQAIAFSESDIELRPMTRLPQHSNAMTYDALDAEGSLLFSRTYFSVGGGFVESDDEIGQPSAPTDKALPYPFDNGDELIALCDSTGMSIADMAHANAVAIYGAEAVDARLTHIWSAMSSCIEAGLQHDGPAPQLQRCAGIGLRRLQH
jgi:L-serine dehydratase